MREKERYIFHDERYAAVGNLIVRAAQDAQAKLDELETGITNSELKGLDAPVDLEARKTLLQEDARILGALATYLDPKWAFSGNENGAGQPDARQNGSGLSLNGAGDTEHKQPEKLIFRGEKNKATFQERTTKFVRTMVAHGNLIEKTDVVSAGTLLKEAVDMDNVTWNNFSTRLRQVGILVYEKERPHSNRVSRAYMDRERVEELIQLGDLPEKLADVLSKLDDTKEPEQRDGVRATIDATKHASETMPEDFQKRMQNGLDSIRTRHTGAHIHQRARAK